MDNTKGDKLISKEVKTEEEKPAKRKRGRPRKIKSIDEDVVKAATQKPRKATTKRSKTSINLAQRFDEVGSNMATSQTIPAYTYGYPVVGGFPMPANQTISMTNQFQQEVYEHLDTDTTGEESLDEVDIETVVNKSTGDFAELKNCKSENKPKEDKTKNPVFGQNIRGMFQQSNNMNPSYGEQFVANNGMLYQMGNQPDVSGGGMFYHPTMYNPSAPHIMYSTNPRNHAVGSGLPSLQYPNQNQQQSDNIPTWSQSDTSDNESDSSAGSPGEGESDGEDGTKTRKKRKKMTKKQKIKRPMNAFMVWAKKHRARLARKYPSLTNSGISIKLGEIWSGMTKEQKKPYFDEAAKIKAKHKKDHPDWTFQPRARRPRNHGAVTRIYAVTENPMGNPYVRQVNTLGPNGMLVGRGLPMGPTLPQTMQANMQLNNLDQNQIMPGYANPAFTNQQIQYQTFQPNGSNMAIANQPYMYASGQAPMPMQFQQRSLSVENQNLGGKSRQRSSHSKNSSRSPSQDLTQGETELIQMPVANLVPSTESHAQQKENLEPMSKKNVTAQLTYMNKGNAGDLQKTEGAKRTPLPGLCNILQKRNVVTSVENAVK